MVQIALNKVAPEEIKAELDQILSSPDFRASKRRRGFLRFVVEEVLAGRAEMIKAYTIAVTVFGRSKDFDSQVDPIVSVEAGRLRRALEHYYLSDGRNDALRIGIPKGTYVPSFRRNEVGSANDASEVSALRQPDDRDQNTSEFLGPGIAVIVFDSLSKAEGQDFFATGISAQLVANLAQFKDFIVVGPLLRRRLENPNQSLISIGQKYGVQFVLSGSVQQRGKRVRVIVKLLDVKSAANIWVKQFDRDFSDPDQFEIEDEISQQISTTLADRTGVIARILVKKTSKKSFSDLTAFEAVLKMYHWNIVLTEKAFKDAWKSLEYAVEKSPDNALAKAWLADIYASDYLSEIGLVKDRLTKAEELAREAVALDPDCQDARWVMGFVHFLRRRPENFIKEFEAALTLNPHSAIVMAIYGLFLPGLGEWERGVRLIEEARFFNPQLTSQYYFPTALNYYRKGEYERAYEESLLIKTPGLFWEPLVRAAVLGQLGRADDAQPYLQIITGLQPTFKERGRDLIRRLLYSEENVDMVYEGLQKVGLQMDAGSELRPIRSA
ncbi:MAG: tetratricopeptide repeat protein [Desulfobacterales bacterium]|nr:tetratricopeptide repeat protein [Desulfobacterales bacterium]